MSTLVCQIQSDSISSCPILSDPVKILSSPVKPCQVMLDPFRSFLMILSDPFRSSRFYSSQFNFCLYLNRFHQSYQLQTGYWLGEFLRDTGLGENFPELADLGPVSHTMSGRFPLHQYMLDTFLEAVGRGEVGKSNDPVLAAPALQDAVFRAGRQAAQLAGRGECMGSTECSTRR